MRRLRDEYLTELQVIETGLTAAGGELSLGSLTYDVLRGAQGIKGVKLNGGDWCIKIDYMDVKKTENTFLAGSVENPLYYIFEDKIHVMSGQENPVIDVYYLKIPTDIFYKIDISADTTPSDTTFAGDPGQGLSSDDDAYNGAPIYSVNQDSYHVVTDYAGATRTFTVEPAASSNFGDDEIYFVTNDYDPLDIGPSATSTSEKVETCELNESLHELVITLAEAECWAMDAQLDRKDAAMQNAELIIKTLNDRYREAEGIGTKGY